MRRSAIDVVTAICAAIFIAILAVSAYFDASIRVLHAVEALPYLLAAILVVRRNKFGYALGFASGGFWLLMSAWRTSFIRNGFERLLSNDWSRPDLLIAVPAALSTGGLALFALIGYARLRGKSARDAALFIAAFAGVAAFFAGIFAAFAPRYLALFRGILPLP